MTTETAGNREEEYNSLSFNEHEAIHDLKHYLPAQSPLKDFIHHNTLHAFQTKPFFDALNSASKILGYKVSLTLEEYRDLYATKRISTNILEQVITDHKGAENLNAWKDKLINTPHDTANCPRIGLLRANWKKQYHIDLDGLVHPILFKILCSYLDQGISIWSFPDSQKGFLGSIREIEKNSFTSFFKTDRAKNLFLNTNCETDHLLSLLIGDASLYKQYLFDMQFAHQGWSGMVSTIEDLPGTLVNSKKISTHEMIVFELLLEIDALDSELGENWKPLAEKLSERPVELFSPVLKTELSEVLSLWQLAFEWSYYDDVLAGIKTQKKDKPVVETKNFQAMFCIDDRECSLRRYLEKFDPHCETFGTPGFFGVEFFFQPEHGRSYTKLCPAPVTPKYLIKEIETKSKRQKEVHFTKQTHSLFRGWLITQTLGFWSAFQLFLNIFRPAMTPATASSFRHMDRISKLTIENKDLNNIENHLQIGFTIEEMSNRVEALLKSIGLVKEFAPLVYVIGHGSSTVNNPHYAAYDCGACSGRPGSVNARVICFMANHPEVRKVLASRGLTIPESTQFVGGLHDTTRDEIAFFDESSLSQKNKEQHDANEIIINKALDHNAKERSRRFESIDTSLTAHRIHDKIKRRSVSLFEPRPELNHATNTLCVIGRRDLTKHIFLDRRAFMNSYDYTIDPEGTILANIMKPIGPVCGGINLEYFFSRVDNQKLGAGTKLPHNVMGLFGVANGIDGDLRPGLPSQMIEVHDPVRLMVIVDHFPEIILKTIKSLDAMYEWYINEWIHLTAVNPVTGELSVFKKGAFVPYQPLQQHIETVKDITPVLESTQENIPVYLID